MITPAFYLGLATHTRQKEQSIGIYHETAVQQRIYEALDTAVIEQGAAFILASELRAGIDRDTAALKELLAGADTAVDKQQLLHDAKNIEQRIILAVECLEVLASD